MRLLSASLRDFRNIAAARIEPGPRATVLVGSNGQGKTNTLEALYYAAALRPLRGSRLSELIRFGAESTEVSASWMMAGGPRSLTVRLDGKQRLLEVDGKRAAALDEYFGQATVVVFTPDDLSLVKGVPEERRRLLDRAVFARWPAYLMESRRYLRALKSRNRLLREQAPDEVRQVFDVQLARLGAIIWQRRLALIQELRPHVEEAFQAVARLPEPLRLRYRSPALALKEEMGLEEMEALFLEGLEAKIPVDTERRFTSVGPHADDLVISIGDKAARLYASQGQQRATVLALKIGEIENLKVRQGDYPLLLLDDVSSELDPERNGHLMAYLKALETQVVMSTTDASLVKDAIDDQAIAYEVNAGELKPLS